MSGQASAPIRWWTRSPSRDVILVTVLCVAHGVAFARDWLGHPLADLRADQRFELYLALGTTAGVIVGFTAAALTIYLAVSGGERLRFVRAITGDQLDRTWVAVIRDPLLAVVAFLGAAVWAQADWVVWVVQVAALLLAFRLARLGWLLTRILRLALDDKANDPGVRSRVPSP